MKENKRLKILFLPIWYPSKENRVAGIFTREHAQAVSLYNDVTVLFIEKSAKHVNGLFQIVSDRIEDGIRTIRVRHKSLPVPIISFFIYFWSLFKNLRYLMREGWRADVIHAHSYSVGAPAVILGKIFRIPVVITEHWSGFPLRMLSKTSIFSARFAMNSADMILPVSHNLKDAIKSYGVRNKFTVIPNVINTETFFPSILQHKNEKKRILLVAILKPIKGVPYLFQALSQLKGKRQDFVLDIVGDGPNRRKYELLAKKLNLVDIITFHGLKPKSKVAEYMRECDFLVLSSLWENLPCVLIEAMASGIPVIATDVGGVREMINKNVGFLIPSQSAEALENAIDHMLNTYTNYSSEKIASYAKEKFGHTIVGQQLDEIYRMVM